VSNIHYQVIHELAYRANSLLKHSHRVPPPLSLSHVETTFIACLYIYTYEYSIKETGARRKAGQVNEERSPEKEAKDLRNWWKAPFCSVGILSTLFTSSLSGVDMFYILHV